MEAAAHPWPTLGVLMLRDGLVTKEQLEAILDQQRDSRQQRMSGHRLGEILIERGLVTPTDVAKLVAEQYELPFADLDQGDIDLRVAHRISEDLARRLSAIPISARPNGTCVLAIADPATVLFSDELREVLGSALQFVVVGPDAMEAAIEFVFESPHTPHAVLETTEPDYFVSAVIEPRNEDEPTFAREAAAVPVGGPPPTTHHNPPLGVLLVREGLVSEDELDAALAQQRLSTSWRLGEILVNRGVVTPSAIARVIAEQYELPFVDLANAYVDPAVVTRLSREIARNFPAVPIAEASDGSLQVAIADPTNVYYSDQLRAALGVPLTFVVAAPDAIDEVLEAAYESTTPPQYVDLPAPSETPLSTVTLDPEWADAEAADSGEAEARFDAVADEDVGGEIALVTDRLTARLQEHVAPDDVEEPPTADSDDTDVLQAHVAGDRPVATETAGDEPILGWLPTWTTEIQLVDHEEALDAEPDPDPAETDDLSAALLAEVAQDTESDEAAHDDDAVGEFEVESGPRSEHEAEDASAEPAPVIVLADYAFVEPVNEDPEGEEQIAEETESEDDAVPSAFDEPLEVDAATPISAPDEVDLAVEEVLRLDASAIHFSPNEAEYVVRARVDGAVRELGVVAAEDVKPMLESFQRAAAMRIHVFPTSKGEKATLFPLQPTVASVDLSELGLAGDADDVVRDALARPSGAMVVCGPIGSGTTTTLYAALHALTTPDRVVATIEDPIERVLVGVDQVQVDVAGGVTYAEGLRTLLATDSDAVLVGELRDRETAAVAFEGALAGRYVLAGLRAAGAAAGLRRLLDLGSDSSVLCDGLTCVVSQRLVRRVCRDCRETYYATDSDLAELGQPLEDAGPRLLARGRGCKSCEETGFRGRVGLFEALTVTDEVRSLLADDPSMKQLQRAAVAGGMRTLREEGVRLCLEGLTTSAELRRVLGSVR